jgi:hypothetical protein
VCCVSTGQRASAPFEARGPCIEATTSGVGMFKAWHRQGASIMCVCSRSSASQIGGDELSVCQHCHQYAKLIIADVFKCRMSLLKWRRLQSLLTVCLPLCCCRSTLRRSPRSTQLNTLWSCSRGVLRYQGVCWLITSRYTACPAPLATLQISDAYTVPHYTGLTMCSPHYGLHK